MRLNSALLRDYYGRCNQTPVIGFFVGEYFPLHQYHAARGLPEGRLTVADIAAIDWTADYERLYALHARCPGHLPFTASAFPGVPWLEAALGCPMVADHVTGSCRALPAVASDAWPEVPAYGDDNPWVSLCVQLTRALVAQPAGRFALGTTLMRGVADALGALLGMERLIFAMFDEPARVHRLAEQIADFWVRFAQAQLDCLPLVEGGTGSLYGLWVPGRCVVLQEDNASLLSPALYRSFIEPYDLAIAAAFEQCIFHLHPARYMPYRPLLEMPFTAIELHLDRGGPTAQELLPVYREILQARPLLIWGDCTAEDLRVLSTELSPEGLAIVPVVSQPDDAWALWAELNA